MNNPLISVIIPAKNCENYIKETIDSITDQTYENIEIIIVDDKSSDKSREIIENIASENNAIKVIDGNGICSGDARNVAIENSNGEFIVNMDSDDIATTSRIELLYNECSKYESAVVGSFVDIVKEDLTKVKTLSYPTDNLSIRKGFKRRFNRSVIMPGTIMAHSHLLKENKYNIGFKILVDWDLILRLSDNKKVVFANVPQPLYKYRINSTSMTMNHTKRNKYNLMVWYNEYCRAKKLPEANDLEDFEKKIRKNLIHFSIYAFLIGLKYLQQGIWLIKTKKMLKI